MAKLTEEEVRRQMAEILRDQMERPTLRPRTVDGDRARHKMDEDRPVRRPADEDRAAARSF